MVAAGKGGRPDHETKRTIIIEAAADVFFARGFVAGTTKEIAARVGLTQPAIYHYVGSKHVLLEEIVHTVDAHMADALHRGLSRGSTARERLVAIIEEFTEAVVRDRRLFAVYYKEMHVLPPPLREQSEAHEAQFVRAVAAVVRELQEDGQLPAEQPTTAITEAILGMVSWAHQWYRPEGALDAPAIAHMFITLLGLSEEVADDA